MNKIKDFMPKLVMALSGALIGIMIGITSVEGADSGKNLFLIMLCLFLITFVAFYIQLIAHEAGHLLFGLLSGYSFVSFRIQNLVLLRTRKGYELKRLSLPGTGGQCLMSPPAYDDGHYPLIMYNLGGIIVNLFLSVIFLIVYLVLRPRLYFGIFCMAMTIFGIAMFLNNGIPLKTELVSNDGYNALHLHDDEDARKAFWATLKINELQTEGLPLSAADPAWFELSENADLKNPLVNTLLVLKENLAMEKDDLDETENYIDLLLSDKCNLNGISREMIRMDRVYIEAMKEGKEADVSFINVKKTRTLMASMKNYPAVIRTEYILACLNDDPKKAEEWRERLLKIADTYPYPLEISAEKERMDRFDSRMAERSR